MEAAAVEILRRLVEALVAALNKHDEVPECLSTRFVYRGVNIALSVRFDAGAPNVDAAHLLSLPHHAPMLVFSEQ